MEGGLETGDAMRKIFATDASEYQEMPAAVAFPASESDVRELILFAAAERTSLIPRTAGTSLAGQCVGSGIVVDMSRHFTKILAIDPVARRVRVQPGVVRNELNLALEPHGMLFGPETATANRAMIGGMVGNNSCGANSIVYGSTRDRLISVRGFLSDGSEVTFGPLDRTGFENKCACMETLEGAIYRRIRDLLGEEANRKAIRENFPKPSIPRRNTGFALDMLMDAEVFDPASSTPFNMCRLLAGSEGTLFFAVEIELSCDPMPPPEAALLCGHFASVDEALAANILALSHHPSACELIDRNILECTKANLSQQRNRSFVEGDPAAILVVEIRRNSRAEVESDMRALTQEWQAASLGYAYPTLWGGEAKKVWELRRAGQGLLSNMPGDAKPREVVEDTAVDVRDLRDYIAEFDCLLHEKYHLNTVYYAHAGTGELHNRPIFDLKSAEGLRTFRGVATDIAHLVKKYRGSLSGEHGDGRLRGEFIPLMVGAHCYSLLREVKAAFDPQGIFNPGKIVDTPPMDSCLRHSSDHPTPQYPTFLDFSEVGGIVRAAEKCNGSADCRKSHLAGGTMCPSYMVTKEERHTPRARANILRLALNAPANACAPFDNQEIKDAMDLCMSCKGCKSECPSSVDIAKLKAEFLQNYHDSHGVPARSRMIAYFAICANVASAWPTAYNAIFQTPTLRRMLNPTLGFHPDRTIPRLNSITLRSWFKSRKRLAPLQAKMGRVHLFCDELTNFNDLDIGIATIELLELIGYEVNIPDHAESGRAALSKGMLRRARGYADQNITQLSRIVSAKEPLIGIEPSAILCFRDEYPSLVSPRLRPNACTLAPHCLMLDEFLSSQISQIRHLFTEEKQTILLHGHCHQKALTSMEPTIRALSIPANYAVQAIPSGCCGMAGSFGYEREHYDISMQAGELVLFPAIRNQPANTLIAASGTSCRHQIRDGTNRTALHPAQILRAALK